MESFTINCNKKWSSAEPALANHVVARKLAHSCQYPYLYIAYGTLITNYALQVKKADNMPPVNYNANT